VGSRSSNLAAIEKTNATSYLWLIILL